MARFLVTGAAGFIGAQVCAELLRRGETVVGVDNLNDAYDPRLKEWRLARLQAQEGFTFLRLDIADAAAVQTLPGQGPFEAVLNLAARAGVRASVRAPELYVQANMVGALNMLELCRAQGIPKFVQASTSSLYGAHNPRPFSEQADISRPLSPYAATKGGAEMLCHSFHALHGLDVSILRYFTVYGPAGRPEMSIFRFVLWVEEGRPIVLYGDGSQERDFTYIDDIVRGTLAALKPLGFEVINLGSDKSQVYWAALLIRVGQATEDQTIGDAHKLYQQECQDQFNRSKPQLGPVYGRHTDDGADSIHVQEESDQEFEQLPVLAHIFQSCPQALEAGR